MKAVALYTGHAQSVAVIEDGKVILAMEEERPTRIKHTNPAPNAHLPERGMAWLADQGHTFDNADLIVYGMPTPASGAIDPLLPAAGVERERAERLKPKVRCVEHHLSHVALAYAWSGWDDCYALAIDGGGSVSYGLAARCRNGVIEEIARDEMTNLTSIMSSGLFYIFITDALGFRSMMDEGKVQSLAAYGNPNRFATLFHDRYDVKPFNITDPLKPGATRADGTWHPTREAIQEIIGVDPRDESVRADVAAAAQNFFEHIVFTNVRAFVPRGCKLVVSGGIFANVVLNLKLLDWVDELWVCPPMGDSGIAAGAGIYASGLINSYAVNDVYLGCDAGPVSSNVSPADVARMIADGAIVGLCHGRCELGPRALGARSIVCDPTRLDMNARLNSALARTAFQPFAPVILSEYVDDIVDPVWRRAARACEFMTITVKVRDEWKHRIPGVVHVDGTCRPQVLRREVNPFYYDVVDEFRKITGVPVLINTSFNIHSEAIIYGESDAHDTLRRSGIDVVVTASGVRKK